MKTSTILIAAAAVVGGVILYEQLKPKPQATSPFVQIGSGAGSLLQGFASLLGGTSASSSQTQPVTSRIGDIDLNQSSFSKRAPGWDSLGQAT